MLYIIGLGLHDEKDISIRSKEILENSDIIYLESYTYVSDFDKQKLEKLISKKIIELQRKEIEDGMSKIVEQAKDKEVALLVGGDPVSATTHIEIFKEAKEKGIECRIIHNASIFTAVSLTGMQIYKFGRTTSIPFPESNPNVETPYNVIKENLSIGLHTLILLDLDPENKKYLTIPDSISYLLKVESKRKEKVFTKNTICIGCARLGGDYKIVSGKAYELQKIDFGRAPFCLVVPGKLHFSEEEMIKLWK